MISQRAKRIVFVFGLLFGITAIYGLPKMPGRIQVPKINLILRYKYLDKGCSNFNLNSKKGLNIHYYFHKNTNFNKIKVILIYVNEILLVIEIKFFFIKKQQKKKPLRQCDKLPKCCFKKGSWFVCKVLQNQTQLMCSLHQTVTEEDLEVIQRYTAVIKTIENERSCEEEATGQLVFLNLSVNCRIRNNGQYNGSRTSTLRTNRGFCCLLFFFKKKFLKIRHNPICFSILRTTSLCGHGLVLVPNALKNGMKCNQLEVNHMSIFFIQNLQQEIIVRVLRWKEL